MNQSNVGDLEARVIAEGMVAFPTIFKLIKENIPECLPNFKLFADRNAKEIIKTLQKHRKADKVEVVLRDIAHLMPDGEANGFMYWVIVDLPNKKDDGDALLEYMYYVRVDANNKPIAAFEISAAEAKASSIKH
jgi:hypothetical protein